MAMMTVTIDVDPYLSEYARGKFYDTKVGAVRFPWQTDIYALIYDLMQRRPADKPVDRGNLTIALPDRGCADDPGGKDPMTYNYLSSRSAELINKKLRVMMRAELHDVMDENKHLRGIQFKETVYRFLLRYDISSITEDALLKDYQRWRDKQRRSLKRGYAKSSKKMA